MRSNGVLIISYYIDLVKRFKVLKQIKKISILKEESISQFSKPPAILGYSQPLKWVRL